MYDMACDPGRSGDAPGGPHQPGVPAEDKELHTTLVEREEQRQQREQYGTREEERPQQDELARLRQRLQLEIARRFGVRRAIHHLRTGVSDVMSAAASSLAVRKRAKRYTSFAYAA